MTNNAADDPGFVYRCEESSDIECAETCVSLEACQDCNCAVVQQDGGGPWGDFMDVFFGLVPIIFLIIVTVKPHPMPTTRSLPLAAFMMYLIRLMYYASDPVLTNGAVILGLHEALTPLSIMAGAITLFECMEATYCMPYMMREMKELTAGHPIAEMMLIFCFAYMVEGASGFGTPVALGAPMLVCTGHAAFESVVVLLIMNTFATVWGAVGTPIWFGFGTLGLTDDEFTSISQKAGVALAFGAYLLIPFVLAILAPWKMVWENKVFIAASLATVIGPSLGLAFVSYEFPALLGGIVGCGLTSVFIKFKFGLKELSPEDEEKLGRSVDDIGSYYSAASSFSEDGGQRSKGYNKASSKMSEETTDPPERIDGSTEEAKETEEATEEQKTDDEEKAKPDEQGASFPRKKVSFDELPSFAMEEAPSQKDESIDDHLGPRPESNREYYKELVMRTSPLWAVVVILILTRVEQIGIKEYLIKREPYFSIHFGTYGEFRLSVSIVFQLIDIMTYPNLNWEYEFLYVPFFIPFLLVSLIIIFIYRKDLSCSPMDIARTVTGRLKNPAIALMGALVLVQLLIQDGPEAPAFILGSVLADWFKEGFVVISPLLGALGSFFSGSTTVSNLTFGEIQKIAAEAIGTSKTTMLALQAVGGSAGNGICLNNIIAACAVVGLSIGEGKIMMRTVKFVLLNTTIATVVMLAFFFRF